MEIKDIKAIQILDSRGNPTIETTITLENGIYASASVPTGASTGKYEALELRDNDLHSWNGKGVEKAINNVNTEIKNELVGKDAENQKLIDNLMIQLDGTENKSRLGTNAILSVSMSIARAAAKSKNLELFEYIGNLTGNKNFKIPNPLVVMLCGGKHGNWAIDIQEISLFARENSFKDFKSKLEGIVKIFNSLGKNLEERHYSTGVGFEGAFAPMELKSNEEALDLLLQVIKNTGFINKFDIGIDAAASEFFIDGAYFITTEEGKRYSSTEWREKLIDWTKKYPIFLFEDIFDQDDLESWSEFNSKIGGECLVVGDDLTVTNIKRIKMAIEKNALNSVLIKLNQIGTVSETIDAVKLCQENNLKTIISHRSAETNDDFIADLAVGVGGEMVKFGAVNRGERIAKYNRLLKIEEILDNK